MILRLILALTCVAVLLLAAEFTLIVAAYESANAKPRASHTQPTYKITPHPLPCVACVHLMEEPK